MFGRFLQMYQRRQRLAAFRKWLVNAGEALQTWEDDYDLKPNSTSLSRLSFHQGQVMRAVDPASAVSIFHDIFVKREYDIPALKHARVIVDIGANIGLFALWARLQNPRGRLFCYEAAPATFEILCQNLRQAPLQNCQAVHAAVSHEGGELTLHVPQNAGWASIYATDGAAKGAPVRVPAVTFQAIIAAIGSNHIDVLKIDIEGAEYPLLLEGPGLQGLRVDHLLVEVDRHPRGGVYSFAQMMGRLHQHFEKVECLHGEESMYPIMHASGWKSP